MSYLEQLWRAGTELGYDLCQFTATTLSPFWSIDEEYGSVKGFLNIVWIFDKILRMCKAVLDD